MEIQAQPTNPPSGIMLTSNQIFTGRIHAVFTFNHQGFGRTNVGLWSVTKNTWAALATLDTDDTNNLSFFAGDPSTEYKLPGSPFMNRWITIVIDIPDMVLFSVDGGVVAGMPLLVPDGFRLAVNVGCASWKSGANDTFFSAITASSR
jgi:hypothetical protein